MLTLTRYWRVLINKYCNSHPVVHPLLCPIHVRCDDNSPRADQIWHGRECNLCQWWRRCDWIGVERNWLTFSCFSSSHPLSSVSRPSSGCCFILWSGVTTMLNFFTTSNGFRSTLPVVSNLTAMNVWDGVCMCFIYASLLEFVCVNYVGRKRPLHNVVYRPGENPVTQVNFIIVTLLNKILLKLVLRHVIINCVARFYSQWNYSGDWLNDKKEKRNCS